MKVCDVCSKNKVQVTHGDPLVLRKVTLIIRTETPSGTATETEEFVVWTSDDVCQPCIDRVSGVLQYGPKRLADIPRMEADYTRALWQK